MNREEAKKLIPLIQAFADGKTIQAKNGKGWEDLVYPNFTREPEGYRIKPEPQVKYYVCRSDGTYLTEFTDRGRGIGGSVVEVKAIDMAKRYTESPMNKMFSPYTVKRFVEDLDYKPAS